MKLTKYAHACMVLEEQGKKLVIDPGEFTSDFGGTDNIAAVVVTHVHGDHFSSKHLQAIVAANPDAKIFTTAEVSNAWADPHVQMVQAGEEQTAGPFKLRFFGELHALIHSIAPQNQNVGVLVNDNFYYPGDSFTLPETKVAVLAVPANAPWAKVGESIDFLQAVGPTQFIRTHDGLLNEIGMSITDTWFKMASDKFGHAFNPLEPGESLEF